MNGLRKFNQEIHVDWLINKDENAVFSIISFVEENDIKIKNIYTSTIRSNVDLNFKLPKIFNLYDWKNDYNFLKMSNVFEMSFYKTPEIFDSLKLIGLKFFIQHHKPKILTVYNSNRSINKSIKSYCDNNNIKCSFLATKKNIFKLKNLLPTFITTIAWFLNYYYKNKSNKINKWVDTERAIFAMGYFTHLSKNDLQLGKFKSGMWGAFDNFFKEINFLHHFIPNQITENIQVGEKQLEKISSNEISHNFIESFLTINSMLKIIFIYIKIFFKTSLVKNSYRKKLNKSFGIDIFNFNNFNFKSSTIGINLIQNIFWAVHFDKIFSKIKFQKAGFYLMENQGWELACVTARKKYNHGKLFAIQHSTLSFWDLRYSNSFDNIKFSPDYYLVNSNSNFLSFTAYNYSKDKILEVESLRYYYLSDILTKKLNNSVLILGDIIFKSTRKMLLIINKVLDVNEYLKYNFKPHPGLNVKIKKVDKRIKLISGRMDELLKTHSTIICPSSSGVALEAYALGLKVIIFITPGELNTSPLRKMESIYFVSNEDELLRALKSENTNKSNNGVINFTKGSPKFKKAIMNILNHN